MPRAAATKSISLGHASSRYKSKIGVRFAQETKYSIGKAMFNSKRRNIYFPKFVPLLLNLNNDTIQNLAEGLHPQ